MKSRKIIALPMKNNEKILSEDQRKYLAYRHACYLKITPKFWQKHYLKIWEIVWWLGKLSLGIFLLALFLMLIAIGIGVK